MNAEILFYCEVRVERKCFIAQRTHINLLVFLDVFRAFV
jgi:hypothetical protein